MHRKMRLLIGLTLLACPILVGSVYADEPVVDQSAYLIRPGDKIKVTIFGESEMSGVFAVNDQGRLNYPMLGEVPVDGMSLEVFKDFLTKKLSEDFLVNPQIQVDYEESPSKSVSILGQVNKPGNYILSPNLTLVRLISQIGGFTTQAAPDRVKLVRVEKATGKKAMDINVTKIMRGESDDVALIPGDMIYVEKEESLSNTVSILGQVSRPGNYALTSDMSLIRLISEAGGFTPIAAPGNVRVVRKSADGKDASFHVDANKIISGKQSDILLEPKDLVVVGESLF